jgi:hypothetical protein
VYDAPSRASSALRRALVRCDCGAHAARAARDLRAISRQSQKRLQNGHFFTVEKIVCAAAQTPLTAFSTPRARRKIDARAAVLRHEKKVAQISSGTVATTAARAGIARIGANRFAKASFDFAPQAPGQGRRHGPAAPIHARRDA